MEVHIGPQDLLWEIVPMWLVVIVSIMASICVWGGVLKEKREPPKDARSEMIKTLMCYLFALLAYGYCLYAPNIITNDVHHMTAALASIHNVAVDTPFNIKTTGIYGHYAIFFWPFLKLFGHKAIAVAVMISCVGVLSEIFLMYAIHYTIRSNVIRRVAALASAMFVVAIGQKAYFQLNPLRMLPPTLMMAYVVWLRKDTKHCLKAKLIAGYGLCALCVTWITDVGIIAAIAYSAWIVCYFWQHETIFSKKMLGIYAGVGLGTIVSVLGMVFLVNFYNVAICHARPVFRACFFPFVGGNGFAEGGSFAESLQIPVLWENFSWIYVLLLFFVGIAKGMSDTKVLQGQYAENRREDVLFLCAVMGLGQSGYYFNRAVYGSLGIVLPEAVICMGIMASWLVAESEKHDDFSAAKAIQKGVSTVVLAQLAVLAVASILIAGDGVRRRTEASLFDLTPLYQTAEKVKIKIPKDTYAVGGGVAEIYAELGWDPGYHYRDVSDFWGDGIEEIREEINSQSAILVNSIDAYLRKLLDNPDEWQLVDTIEMYNVTLDYYVKKTGK